MYFLKVIGKLYWTLFIFFENRAAKDDFLSMMKALTFLTLFEFMVIKSILNLLVLLKKALIISYLIDLAIIALFFLCNILIISNISIDKNNIYQSRVVFICIIISFLIFILSF